MHFDLETFMDSLFAENQSVMFVIHIFIYFIFPAVYIIVSAAILKIMLNISFWIEASILRNLDRH